MNESKNKYGRVMSRVHDRSRSSLDSHSLVTRHEKSSSKVGAKPLHSNVSSSVFSELPTVLDDYKPEEVVKKPVKRSNVVKPRRTIKSMDPRLSPHKSPKLNEKSSVSHIRAQNSAPTVRRLDSEGWSDSHMRQCHSSRSHDKLNQLKDEINSFRETEKFLHLRAKLYKSCGVVLDDVGQVCRDQAVQVETRDDDQGDHSR